MTTLIAIPETPWARFRSAVGDGLVLIGRELGRLRNEPGELIGMIIFPGLMVVLFGYVFGSAIAVPGGGNYREYLMPGLFAMLTVSSVAGTCLRVATDATRGVMDRFRSMPMARSAVPFGQTGADLLGGVLAMSIMAAMGLAVGWRAHEGPLHILAAFLLLTLLRYALAWAGVYLGLVVKNEGTADQLVPLFLPITMLSNAFVPTTGMPTWLRVIADWNPVSCAVAAARDLFGNPGTPTGNVAWPLAHPVTATLLWTATLLTIFVPLSIRTYRLKGR